MRVSKKFCLLIDRLDNPIEFQAINANNLSRYYLKGAYAKTSLSKYGPNNLGRYGRYAYIYLEIGGALIDDLYVVATWATIRDNDVLTNFETGECRVRYSRWEDHADSHADYNDINVRTY